MFIKLSVHYYDDVVLASLEDAHEVMFTRGLAYCGRTPTGGLILRSKVLELTRKTTQAQALRVAERLCQPVGDFEGPWVKVAAGYQVRNWSHYQDQLDQIESRRKADRERKRSERQRKTVRGTSRDMSQDESRDVTGGDKEREGDAAAAARGGSVDLPGDLLVLRTKFREWTALAEVSWSSLKADQVAEISQLIATHGDTRLLETAKATHRSAAFVQAFIPTWRDLAGPRLVAADEPRCDVCGTTERRHDAAAYADHEFQEAS